jgi:tetratricopeptide (TPR) repeat protein
MWHVLFLLLLAADTGPADRLFREGKFAEAVTAYGRLVNADPSAADAMAGLGRSLLELHRTADAIQYLERAVRLKPDLVEARLALARAFVESGNLGPVMSLVEPVYERQPADPQTLRLMIEGFYGGGYYQRALQLIGELRKMQPGDLRIRQLYAVSLAKVGRDAEAEAACKALMDEKPEALDPDVTLTWVQILYEHGRIEAALPYADKVVAQQPRNPIAALWKARLLAGSGHTVEAIKEAELSVSLAPGLPFARTLLLELYRKTGRERDAERETEWLRNFNDRAAAGRGR